MIKYKKMSVGQLSVTLFRRYRRHGVARSCAALTYYLVFAAFPLLLLLGALPGALGVESSSLLQAVERFVPEAVTAIVERYWQDAEQNGSKMLLWSGLLFFLWFPARATDCLLYALRRAFGVLKPPGLVEKLKTLLFSVGLLLTLILSLLLITVGRRALRYLAVRLELPEWVPEIWNTGRFVLLGFVLTAALCVLYMLALGRRHPLRRMMPGVLASLAAWMAVSAGFSYYVEHLADYTPLYGSVTAVVVTLLWMYLSGMVLIMGAEFNAVLQRRTGPEKKG